MQIPGGANADFWVNMQTSIGAEEPLQAQSLLVLAKMQGSKHASNALCLAYISSSSYALSYVPSIHC